MKTWKTLPQDVQETLVSLGKKQEALTLAMSKGWEQKFTAETVKGGGDSDHPFPGGASENR